MKGPYLPIEYPKDYSTLTADAPFTIGRSTVHGHAVQLDLRHGGGFIVAARGGGGTSMLNTLTASLARMDDTLVWHIDRNNGSLSAPWCIDPDSRPVDWVAVTDDEALRMVQAAVRIARARVSRYTSDLLRTNKTILSVRQNLPQIVILIGKERDPDSPIGEKIQAELAELRRIGRPVRVVAVTANLRATSDHMPVGEKKDAQFAIAGKVKDHSELAHAFDWDKTVPDPPTERGQYVIGDPDGYDKFDGYWLTPAAIRELAAAVTDIRDEVTLDKPSADVAGEDYSTRWQRKDTRRWLAHLRGEPTAEELKLSDDGSTALDEALSEAVPFINTDGLAQVETLGDLLQWVRALTTELKNRHPF